MHIVVLGCGLVGSAIAKDLAQDFTVTVTDLNETALERLSGASNIQTIRADLSVAESITSLIRDADVVVGAVPGFMGFATLKAVVEAGKNIVDISFFPEDPFVLDEIAKEKGVTTIMDCGLAPGIGNILLGQASVEFESIERFVCYVGGLPVVRRKPFEYAAVFSPIDVIEEYTRPARYVENGILVTREALSDVEEITFDSVGTLEAFNTDGLRTLAVTMSGIPNMKEKTMRYPGHAGLMRVFRETGLFSFEPVDVCGQRIRPIDVTAALLFPKWTLREGEEDMSIMRVEIEGTLGGKRILKRFELLDRFDRATGTTSMARTTGYTCAMAVRLVADGTYAVKGISPPEFLGRDRNVSGRMFLGLKERNVTLNEQRIEA